MEIQIQCAAIVAAGLLALAPGAQGQSIPGSGRVMIPDSSVEHPGDAGVRSHTHIQAFVPDGGLPQTGPPVSGLFFETPASAGCIYGLVSPIVPGCNPNTVTANPIGGSKAIAIVDAYDDPTAATDLAAFCTQFGLAPANFTVVYASGTQPAQDPTGGWELEESLDIEWAHAMAPGAKLYLVEAASNSNADLFAAVAVANSLVAAAGGGEISMSWGGPEFKGQRLFDTLFTQSNVVYFASTGDAPGVGYPATSPNVVAAGGTTINRNTATGAVLTETPWDLAGGGVSALESRPTYQNGIASIVGGARGVPDVSFDSNPTTGVYILSSTPVNGQGGPGAWWIVGGTSVASPSLAGIVNSAGHFAASTAAELTTVYNNMSNGADFRDITYGYCGPYAGYFTKAGWDFCTGVGSDIGKQGK